VIDSSRQRDPVDTDNGPDSPLAVNVRVAKVAQLNPLPSFTVSATITSTTHAAETKQRTCFDTGVVQAALTATVPIVGEFADLAIALLNGSSMMRRG
jgi:hypothetical protein